MQTHAAPPHVHLQGSPPCSSTSSQQRPPLMLPPSIQTSPSSQRGSVCLTCIRIRRQPSARWWLSWLHASILRQVRHTHSPLAPYSHVRRLPSTWNTDVSIFWVV